MEAAPPRRYKTPYQVRKYHKSRRSTNALTSRCINDTKAGTHGPPERAGRCAACYETYKRTW